MRAGFVIGGGGGGVMDGGRCACEGEEGEEESGHAYPPVDVVRACQSHDGWRKDDARASSWLVRVVTVACCC